MIKKILISERVKDYIEIRKVEDIQLQTVNDIKQEIETNLFSSAEYDSIVFLLLFLDEENLANLEKTLQQQRFKYFYYKIILFHRNPALDITLFLDKFNIHTLRTTLITASEYLFLVKNIFKIMQNNHHAEIKEKTKISELQDIRNDQDDLLAIGKALSVEKDQDKLLSKILYFSQKITGADAGSIFLIRDLAAGSRELVFKYASTYSLDISYQEFVMPLNKNSIAGYVAVTGEILNIPDAYLLSNKDPVSFNSSFDKANNYRTKSMLVVPMRNYMDEIIGVIQLLNSKEIPPSGTNINHDDVFRIRLQSKQDFETKIVPFQKKYETILVAIANQAAIAIENNLMIRQIRNQFEEFVKASVTAIESRDPATSGHSFRVAEICRKLAIAINRETEGVFANLHFTKTQLKELEYAALLHDFGKVYIDTAIFSKAKKLFPGDFEYLLLKLEYIYRYLELKYSRQELQLKEKADSNLKQQQEVLYLEKAMCLERIIRMKALITDLNEPCIEDTDPAVIISQLEEELTSFDCQNIDGRKIVILSENEKLNLSIKRGSLNPRERVEIESHVIRSFNFVSKIPWPAEFRRIPEFTQKHHEKMDGTGYPNHLKGEQEIPVQARMISIADIFDALSAGDRPYKKAQSLEKILFILQEEAKQNKIDKNLLDIFIKYKIFESGNP